MSTSNIIYDILDFTWNKETTTFIGNSHTLRPVEYYTYYNTRLRQNVQCWKTNKMYSIGMTFPSGRKKFYIGNTRTGNKYRFILRKELDEYLEFITECNTYTCKIYL